MVVLSPLAISWWMRCSAAQVSPAFYHCPSTGLGDTCTTSDNCVEATIKHQDRSVTWCTIEKGSRRDESLNGECKSVIVMIHFPNSLLPHCCSFVLRRLNTATICKLSKIALGWRNRYFIILVINTFSSFILGLFISILPKIKSLTFSSQLALFFLIGFLGSLSTFSTFVYD